jgi:hypothetical protein
MLSMTLPRIEVEKSSVRKYILGGGTSSRERGESGPKYMTVGWVIFTVPRRKRVSQAVVADIARAIIETVIATGSVI